MPISVIRFDMRSPGLDPNETKNRYAVALEMAEWADKKGFGLCVISEHHGTDDGFLPSPLVMAAAVAARTENILLNVAALLVPLHDPIGLAEDIAVLDHLCAGRLSITAGLGYRPVEYEMFGREWKNRGRRFNECLEVMAKAWTGEQFEYEGRRVRVTPTPFSQPQPLIMIAGFSRKAAERAARYGSGFFPAIDDDDLVAAYLEECEKLGKEPGFVNQLPQGMPGTVVISEDPDRTWAEVGPYLLREATAYAKWQTPDVRSLVTSKATNLAELRAEGIYRVMTPDECLEMCRSMGQLAAVVVHPLCGGTPADLAWPSMELFADKVLPHMAGIST